jgi:hypothetical protein
MTLQQMFNGTCTIRPFTGTGSRGAQYGTAVTVPCYFNDGRRFGQSAERSEVLAETVIYMGLDEVCPASSKVTVDGREFTAVRAVKRRGGRSRARMNHLEVVLQ